jgi:hypothetical protein
VFKRKGVPLFDEHSAVVLGVLMIGLDLHASVMITKTIEENIGRMLQEVGKF